MLSIRVGQGFDVHKLIIKPERPLVLMGCVIPYHMTLLGHSDADVMLHALMDAILGAAGLGDIGQHFPDSDSFYLNYDSVELLKLVIAKISAINWQVINADICLICEYPKIALYKTAMKQRIAPIIGVKSPNDINIKATTTERLGFTGRQEGIAAQAVVLLQKQM